MIAATAKFSARDRLFKYVSNCFGSSCKRLALCARSPAVSSASRSRALHWDSRYSREEAAASLMNSATFFMKAGLIAHSTETVATTAVTSAGIAATRAKSATTRECRRAPARAARRAARRLRSSSPIMIKRLKVTRPSPARIVRTIALRRDYRGKAGENDECGERQNQRRADRHGPKTPRGATFQSRIGENNRWFAATRVGLRGHVPNRGHVSPGMNDSLVAVRQLCCKIATKTRRAYLSPRRPLRSRSRIFLRSVFRFRPKTSAALIWLPRVADKVAASKGASNSRNRR